MSISCAIFVPLLSDISGISHCADTLCLVKSTKGGASTCVIVLLFALDAPACVASRPRSSSIWLEDLRLVLHHCCFIGSDSENGEGSSRVDYVDMTSFHEEEHFFDTVKGVNVLGNCCLHLKSKIGALMSPYFSEPITPTP